ncbi:MAG: histidinol-phosphate transaminase [Vicinamibacterales bacterium]
MSHDYEKVVTPPQGLRLHLNENTAGCSTAVLDALRRITCHEAAFYPDYAAATAACARHLRVAEPNLLLTNGLDEGILAASVLALRGGGGERPFEAIVVVPAFDMYASRADAVGGRVVEIPCGDGFAFPLDTVLRALNGRTRIVFLTNPNNPTGIAIPRDSIMTIAEAAPGATVFVDEAYADFSGTSLLRDDAYARYRNVVIGRTFAKAFGLAGLRVGALIGTAERIAGLRRIVPPYSLNVAAAVALPAALADTAHYESYLTQTRASKELLYAALDALEVRYWRSDANFVLANFSDDRRRVLDGLTARGVHVRDRSADHGCAGCLRITTGVLDHTRAAIKGIEEIMCAAQ